MKKKINLLGLLFFLFLVNLNAQRSYFYYYEGEKQYLDLDTKHIFASVVDENAINMFVSDKLKHKPLRVDISDKVQSKVKNKRFWTELSVGDSLSDEAYLSKLSEIRKAGKDIIVAPYFKNKRQNKIGLSNFFYVKLKSVSDTILLKQEIEKEYAVIVYQNQFMPLWFVASITENSKCNAMEMANRLYESGLFQCAEPDLMVDDKPNCVNDQFFGQQWGLSNTGQNGGKSGIDIKSCDTRQISTGMNVTVAVLDQGIDLSHPDLAANIHPLSFDSETGTVPQIVYGDHGTACAGIIGAVSNNSIGIAGVAPNCRLMSVSNSLGGTPLSRMNRADGINWAWQNGADVISNSWGSSVQYQVIDDAINNAVIQGRGGKGCVVVFASGNDNAASVNYPASLQNVIAVGAIDKCGIRSGRIDIIPNSCDPWCSTCEPGSAYGSALSVVAPGTNIYTTDRQGNAGYNTTTGTSGNYYANFGGTSAACPHVSGIAALILSVRPDLTQAQVRQAIETNCTKLSGYTFSSNSSHPNGTWNNQVGHGLVNAYAAVYSIAPRITGPTLVCQSGGSFTVINPPAGFTWNKSYNLNIVSTGNNTVSVSPVYTRGDAGWVSINLNGVELAKKEIWVGSPIISSIAGSTSVPSYQTVRFTAKYNYLTDINPSNSSNWEWLVQGNGGFIYNRGENLDVSFTPGYYQVVCRAANSCGWGDYTVISVNALNSVSYSIIYPNPANDLLNIDIKEGEGMQPAFASMATDIEATDAPLLITNDEQSKNFDIRLYNEMGVQLRQTTAKKGGKVQFNLSNLPNGNYYLHIYDGVNDKPEMKQIVIKH